MSHGPNRPSWSTFPAPLARVVAIGAVFAFALLAVGCSSSSGTSTAASNATCQATIGQGALSGKLAGATCEYLGVPYAAPPTGSLRFAPPQPASGWSGTRDATSYGPSCFQASNVLGAGSTPPSEDCLSVNVFTPQGAPAQPLPVMVFIYGGAFTSGSSSLYDGQALSERGPVVVVTMNYRLGALGFLALPQLDSERAGAPSGSDGIRDQQLALKWVQDNVGLFHGDKNNVTVFGESAGSMSTCIHLVSPESQGLASRYIMESGACVGKAPLLNSKAQAYSIGQALAASICAPNAVAALGADAGALIGSTVADASADDLMKCLRAEDPMTLMTWAPPAGFMSSGVSSLLGGLLGPPFAPTVEGPGGVLPDMPANLIAAGKFNTKAQVLAGTNKNEWGLFVELAQLEGGSAASMLNITSTAQLNAGIEQIFGSTQGAMVEAQYPSTDATAGQVFVDLVTDYAFRCPTRDLAQTTMAQGVSTYYLDSYEVGEAYHSFELVPLFEPTGLTILGATDPSAGFKQEMLGYWAQFAATGNPNAPSGAAPQWPGYTASGDMYMELLDPTPMANANLRKAQCDFWDSFTAPGM
jgi:para-nitrobenzyl esterase